MDKLTPKQKEAREAFVLFMSDGFKRQIEEMQEKQGKERERRKSEEIGRVLEHNPYF